MQSLWLFAEDGPCTGPGIASAPLRRAAGGAVLEQIAAFPVEIRIEPTVHASAMANRRDEWRAVAITAVLGTLVLLVVAWLTGMLSLTP